LLSELLKTKKIIPFEPKIIAELLEYLGTKENLLTSEFCILVQSLQCVDVQHSATNEVVL